MTVNAESELMLGGWLPICRGRERPGIFAANSTDATNKHKDAIVRTTHDSIGSAPGSSG